MADDFIRIEIENLDKLMAALRQFPKRTAKYLGAAGREAATRVILNTPGLKKYPRSGKGAPQAKNWTDKQRRYFFWALKQGMIEVPYRRGQSPGSEKFGTKWTVQTKGFSTEIGNNASYASLLSGGEGEQSKYMAARGWRSLIEVAKEKLQDIEKVYNAWIDRLLKDINLK